MRHYKYNGLNTTLWNPLHLALWNPTSGSAVGSTAIPIDTAAVWTNSDGVAWVDDIDNNWGVDI